MIEIELYQKKIVKMITTLYHIHLLIIISNSTHWQDKITPNNNTYALYVCRTTIPNMRIIAAYCK